MIGNSILTMVVTMRDGGDVDAFHSEIVRTIVGGVISNKLSQTKRPEDISEQEALNRKATAWIREAADDGYLFIRPVNRKQFLEYCREENIDPKAAKQLEYSEQLFGYNGKVVIVLLPGATLPGDVARMVVEYQLKLIIEAS